MAVHTLKVLVMKKKASSHLTEQLKVKVKIQDGGSFLTALLLEVTRYEELIEEGYPKVNVWTEDGDVTAEILEHYTFNGS